MMFFLIQLASLVLPEQLLTINDRRWIFRMMWGELTLETLVFIFLWMAFKAA